MEKLASSVRLAISAQHSPLSQEKFLEAHNFIENEFRTSPNCWAVSLSLCRKEESDEIRHFAFQSLNQVAQVRWNSMSADEKNAVKRISLQFLMEAPKPITEERRFIKEKIVQLLVSVVKREWPQNWPELVDQLFQLTQHSNESLELVLIVFRTIADEIEGLDSSMSLRRLDDIRGGLNQRAADIIELFSATIAKAGPGLQASEPTAVSKFLVYAAIEAAAAYAPWVPRTCLFRGSLAPNVAGMACIPELVPIVTRLLTCLAHRSYAPEKFEKPDTYRQHMLLIWEAATLLVERLLVSESMDRDDNLIMAIDLCSELTKNHLMLLLKDDSKIAELKLKLLTVLLNAFRQPSLLIVKHVTAVWNLLLTEEPKRFLPSGDLKRQLVEQLFQTAANHVIRGQHVDQFDSLEEYTAAFGIFRSFTINLLKNLSRDSPRFCLEQCLSKCAQIRSLSAQDHLNKRGFATTESMAYLQWEALTRVIQSIIQGIAPEFFLRTNKYHITDSAEQLLSSIIQCSSEDALLVQQKLGLLSRFTPVLEQNRQALEAVLTEFINALTRFGDPAEVAHTTIASDDLFRTSYYQLRKTAQTSLIHVANKIPGSLIPLFEPLVKQLMPIITAGQQAENMAGLLEFLIIVSNEITDLERRKQFLELMLTDAVSTWVGPQITELLQNSKNFVSLLDITDSARDLRRSIRVVLHTLCSLFRGLRQKHPKDMAAVWRWLTRVLPNVLALCGALNAVYTPEGRACVPEKLRSVLLTSAEFNQRFGQASSHSPSLGVDEQTKLSLRQACSWLTSMREYACTLLAHATVLSDEFYSADPRVLLSTVLSNMQHLELPHLRVIVEKFLSPVLQRCPALSLHTFAGQIFSFCLMSLMGRLDEAWNLYALSKEGQSTRSAEDEIREETNVRDLSRSVAKMLTQLMVPPGWKSSEHKPSSDSEVDKQKSKKKKSRRAKGKRAPISAAPGSSPLPPSSAAPQDEFCSFVLHSTELCELVFRATCMFFKWPDSIALNHATRLCMRFVSALKGDPAFYSHLMQLMVESLTVLSKQFTVETQEELCNLVREVYRTLSLNNCTLPRELLLSINGVDPSDVQCLEKILANPKSELLDQRRATRQFISKHVSKREVSLAPIKDLPRLTVPPKLKRQIGDEVIDIRSLFQTE
eukprot:34371_1